MNRDTNFDGSDEFWAFVADINWPSLHDGMLSPVRYGQIESKMQDNYTAEQIKGFCGECQHLTGRIVKTIQAGLACGAHPGGGDDYSFSDLPSEIVGRGKDFFLEHVHNIPKLMHFGGNKSNVCENFSYIFQSFQWDGDVLLY